MEKVRNCSSAKIRAKTYRYPQIHRFESATIVNSKERVSIADDMDRSRVGNEGPAASVAKPPPLKNADVT